MGGKIINMIVFTFVTIFLIGICIFAVMHIAESSDKDRLNYLLVDAVSTSGILTTNLYDDFKTDLKGDFIIKLVLERQIKAGVYDTFYNESEIVDRHLDRGDRITVFIEDKNPTLFGRLINAPLHFFSPNQIFNLNIKSCHSSIITKSNKNLVKGYDVIADINKRFNDGDFTPTGIAVNVITKLNSTGKYYGNSGHSEISSDNFQYGDTVDEQGNTGINYIFDVGDFYTEYEYYGDGTIKVIKYSQQ